MGAKSNELFEPTKTKRKIVQIAVAPLQRFNGEGKPLNNTPQIVALCDDGAVFRLSPADEWEAVPAIPQDTDNATVTEPVIG